MAYLGRPSEQVEALARAVTALDQIVRRSQSSEVVARGARRLLLAVARRNAVVEGAVAEALDIACAECLAALRAEHAQTMKQHIAQDGHDDPWGDDDDLAKEEFMTWLVDCVQSAPASTSLEIPTISITPPPLNLADVPTDNILEHAFGHIQKCRLDERAELYSLTSTNASPLSLSRVTSVGSLTEMQQTPLEWHAVKHFAVEPVEDKDLKLLAVEPVEDDDLDPWEAEFLANASPLSLSRVTSVGSLTEMQQTPLEWHAVNHFAVEPVEDNDLKLLAVEPVEDDDLDPWEADFLARCYLDQHFSHRKVV